MNYFTAQRNYLESAVQSASQVGLTIMLYDRLVTDLRGACESLKKGDIERRCEQINHAFLILGFLESNIDHEHGGETAKSLAQFYGCLRAQLIEAQVKMAPEMLQKQIELIVQVRQAWQQAEDKAAAVAAGSEAHKQNLSVNAHASRIVQGAPNEAPSSSWTA